MGGIKSLAILMGPAVRGFPLRLDFDRKRYGSQLLVTSLSVLGRTLSQFALVRCWQEAVFKDLFKDTLIHSGDEESAFLACHG